MNARYSPAAADWIKSFSGRYQTIAGTMNALLKEREAQHLSDASEKQIEHKIAALEECLTLLTAPKPRARRGPLPKQSSAPSELPPAKTSEASLSGGQLP